MRFNPFSTVNCKYGAPMGRHGDNPAHYNGTAKLYARHCGGDGFYDRGGAYWGHSRVYAVCGLAAVHGALTLTQQAVPMP